MTEVIEMPGSQSVVPLETVLAPELLAAETIADSAMAELTSAVDAAYAEAGLEASLEGRAVFKTLGSGDIIGYPRRTT